MPVKRQPAANGHCQATTKSGTHCAARAMKGQRLCSLHADPQRAVELGRKGGRRGAHCSTDVLKDVPAPKTAADLRELLAQSIVETRAGNLVPRLANSIAYLGTGFLRALEVSDLEARLLSLEAGPEDGDGKSETKS